MRHRDSDPTVMLGWVLIVVGTTVLVATVMLARAILR
jgi:hypothetical protein